MRIILFTLIIVFLAIASSAQKVISVSDTLPPGHVPFDEVFQISYTPSVKRKVSSIHLFELNKCGCMIPFKCCKTCRSKDKKAARGGKENDLEETSNEVPSGSIESIPINQFTQQDSGTVNFLMPALGPNRRFAVVIATRVKPAGIDKVIELLRGSKVTEAEGVYKEVDSTAEFRLENLNPCSDCKTISFAIGAFSEFQSFYNSHLKPTLDSLGILEAELQEVKRLAPSPGVVNFNFDDAIVKDLVTFSQQCLQCSDTVWQKDWINNRQSLARNIILLDILAQPDVYSGVVSWGNFYSNYSNTDVKVEARINNLNTTIVELSDMIHFYQYFLTKQYGGLIPAAYSNFLQNLVNTLVQLKANYRMWKQYQKSIDDKNKEIRIVQARRDSKLNKWDGFESAFSATTGSTFTYNFDTRASFAIKSDFGFLAYGGLPNNSSVSGFSPFIGFHVNFRPMNTDVPFRQITCKGILGHLAFHSGILIGSFERENKVDGLVSNSAVFTGLGWSFGHGVRLMAGSVWYRQKDPNPLVSTMYTRAVPYTGLALDLRLKEIYDGFKTIFKP